MIHHNITEINNALIEQYPTECGNPVWKVETNGLAKLIWNADNNFRYLHDQERDFIVADDQFDVQTAHVIESVRKTTNVEGVNNQQYRFSCSLVGIGTKLISGLLAFAAFESLEWLNIRAIEFDNNTERILTSYWGINKDTYGQNPEICAWRISYEYTLPRLDRNDLLSLENLPNIDL